jgi:hypothetical protein
MGLLLVVRVRSAGIQDREGAKSVLEVLAADFQHWSLSEPMVAMPVSSSVGWWRISRKYFRL